MVDSSKKVWRFNYPMLLRIMTGVNDEAKSLLRELHLPCDLVDRTGTTLLQYSLKYRNPEMLQHLIEIGHGIEVRDSDGFTPLMFAVNNEDLPALRVLLKCNADIYSIQRDGMSFLQVAVYKRLVSCECSCLKQISHSIFELFIERINHDFLTNNCKITPRLTTTDNLIKLAIVAYGNLEFAKFVLNNNYAINYFAPDKRLTALHWAIIFGKIENAKLLIEHGASAGLLDGILNSPLHYYTVNFERIDKQSEVLKSLIKTQCERGIVISDLQHLLTNGNKETVRVLLQSDIDVVPMEFKDNTSLLHILMENENFDDFDFFAKLITKIDLNLPSFHGTPLRNAVRCGCPKKVEFLLEHGANVNLPARDHHNIIFDAFMSHFPSDSIERNTLLNKVKIVELLLRYGADIQIILNGDKTILDLMKSTYKPKLLTDMVIAQLALLGALGLLIDCIRDQIESDPKFKGYFDLCTREVEELKCVAVYGTVTLLNLLAEKIEKIVMYARNQQFLVAFNCAMKKVTHIQSYYVNTLKEKVSKALFKVELDEKAAAIIEILTGLCMDAYYTIIYKIISYLHLQDLKNLCKVESIILAVK